MMGTGWHFPLPSIRSTFLNSEDCVEVFCNHHEEEVKRLYWIPTKLMGPLMPEEWSEFNALKCCHICTMPFQLSDKDHLTDHDHYTGKHRDAKHPKCNLNYVIPNYIPIIFILHNLSSYNVHLFIRELGKKFNYASALLLRTGKSTSASRSKLS